MNPKIKVCGVTEPSFAVEAARLGVDYVGVIFADRSPRRVSAERAFEIAASVRIARPVSPPKVVGVFVGGDATDIARIADAASLDVVQLHGGHRAAAVARLKGAGLEVWQLAEEGAPPRQSAADAILIDGCRGGNSGGTGMLADWSRVGKLKKKGFRVVLAGGLSADNAAAAAATGADVLDFNSSLETSPGVKSVKRLEEVLRRIWP